MGHLPAASHSTWKCSLTRNAESKRCTIATAKARGRKFPSLRVPFVVARHRPQKNPAQSRARKRRASMSRRAAYLGHVKHEFRTKPAPSKAELAVYQEMLAESSLPWGKRLKHRAAMW